MIDTGRALNTGRVLDSGEVRVSFRSMVTREGDRVEWLKGLISAESGHPFAHLSLTSSKDDPKDLCVVFGWKVYAWLMKLIEEEAN